MTSQGLKPDRHGQRWSEAEDQIIYEAFISGKSTRIMSLRTGRSASGVRKRLRRLGLIDAAGRRIVDPLLFEVIQSRHSVAKPAAGLSQQSETNS